MELKINDKPIEYYFGENIVCKSVGKCVKYYVGNIMVMSINYASIVIVSPIILISYLTS